MKNEEYIRLLRRRYNCQNDENETSEVLDARATFNSMVDEKLSATVHTVRYVNRNDVGVDDEGIEININVTDTSKNDQKTNDEKYFDFKWEMDVDNGDQIYWDGTWWLLYHRERNSVQTHKTFTGKKCNFDYHAEVHGIQYKFPIALVNLTLYSDGMADKVYMSNPEGKRRIYLTNNEHTQKLGLGQRIMISSETVFEISHIDDFSRPGVKECIISQVFITSKDDVENVIAWNDNINKEEPEVAILGSDVVYVGGNEYYTTDVSLKGCVSRLEVTSLDNCVTIDKNFYEENEDGSTVWRVNCVNDIRYIGEEVILRLVTTKGDFTRTIKVKGMF